MYQDAGPRSAGDAQPPAQPGEPGEHPELPAENGEHAESEAGPSGEVSGDAAAVIVNEGMCLQAKSGDEGQIINVAFVRIYDQKMVLVKVTDI